MQIVASCDSLAEWAVQQKGHAVAVPARTLRGLDWKALKSRGKAVEEARALYDGVGSVRLSSEVGEVVSDMQAVGGPKAASCGRVSVATCVVDEDDQWNGETQQDAGEFLGVVLGAMRQEEQDDLARAGQTGPTVVEKTFGGREKVTKTCSLCGLSKVEEHDHTPVIISLPLPVTRSGKPCVGEVRKGVPLDLDQRIAEYFGPEELRRTCDRCHKKAVVESKAFSRAPSKLLVQ